MYQCYLHNWFSHDAPCPSCAKPVTTSDSTNANGTSSEPMEEGEEKRADEKDLIIHGLEEGAELWKEEYDNCREILEGLVTLKEWKDKGINQVQYAEMKPIQWERAKEFLKKYQH